MTTRAKKETAADPAQSARFIEAARELGCDESPDAFEAAVKKVAKAPPTKGTDLKAQKRSKCCGGQSMDGIVSCAEA